MCESTLSVALLGRVLIAGVSSYPSSLHSEFPVSSGAIAIVCEPERSALHHRPGAPVWLLLSCLPHTLQAPQGLFCLLSCPETLDFCWRFGLRTSLYSLVPVWAHPGAKLMENRIGGT